MICCYSSVFRNILPCASVSSLLECQLHFPAKSWYTSPRDPFGVNYPWLGTPTKVVDYVKVDGSVEYKLMM